MNIIELSTFIYEAMQISETIAIRYKLLKTLESSNLRTMTTFNEAKKSLIEALKKEEQFYKKRNLSTEQAMEIINHMQTLFKLNPKTKLEDIIHQNQYDLPKEMRIFFKLDGIIRNSTETHFQKSKEELVKNNIKLPDKEIKRQIQSSLKFQEAILEDYYLIFLSFIERCLQNNEYQDYHSKLLHIKYLIPYLNQNSEKNLINNNFHIPECIYISHKIISDFYRMPKQVQEINIYSTISNIFAKERERILKTLDQEFEDEYLNVLISKLLLRSATIFFDEKFLKDSEELFNENVYDNKEVYKNSNDAIKTVTEIYQGSKKDKELHKSLSLIL